MTEITLEAAVEDDAELLARISKEAFHSDVECGAPGEGGPPGYDSWEWQKAVMRSAAAYLKILVAGKVVGGLIVFDQGNGKYYLGRMFVDPGYQRQGIGLRSVEMLFERYPEAKKWVLDTPAWNTRTRSFYERLGFIVVEEREGLLFFERA
jgi:ribosomal protein S18 acetylase RimI-like enzyme